MTAHDQSRCRLCTANDREALREAFAAELWLRHRGVVHPVPWAQAGAYWHMVFRGLADDAIEMLGPPR
jgi:hypothetical protein